MKGIHFNNLILNMKNFIIISILLLALFTLSSCGNKDNDTNSKMDDTARNEAPSNNNTVDNNTGSQDAKEEKTETTPENKPLTEEVNGGFKINFPRGATEVSIKGNIDGFENITYMMDVSKGQKLTGNIEAISPEGKKQNNIRFSQIISPSGDEDGPFGPAIKYDLTEGGGWQLIVSENQMSGDPWTGEFKMTIGIK